MPKMKTHQATKERFRETKNGKVLYVRKGKRHLLTKKSPDRKRRLSNWGKVDKPDRKRVKRLLG